MVGHQRGNRRAGAFSARVRAVREKRLHRQGVRIVGRHQQRPDAAGCRSVGVGAALEQQADGLRLLLVDRMEERRPAVALVARVRVSARVEQHGHGLDGAVPGGPHHGCDAVFLRVVGRMSIGEETADGVGGIGDGRSGDRTPRGRAAGAGCDQGRAHSQEQHEVPHEDLRTDDTQRTLHCKDKAT